MRDTIHDPSRRLADLTTWIIHFPQHAAHRGLNISLDDGVMPFPEALPDVTGVPHRVVQEAKDAGVWVFGGEVERQRASVVTTDGTITDGPYPETQVGIGGFTIVDVPPREESQERAARLAGAHGKYGKYGRSCPTRTSDRKTAAASATRESCQPSQASPWAVCQRCGW